MAPATFTVDSASVTLRLLPKGSYLVHATNCLGEWGAGFALELRGIFPGAYLQYRTHCDSFKASAEARYATRELVARCHIIPPQDSDAAAGAPKIFIVCLFTSHGYGRANKARAKPGVDRPVQVLSQTKQALSRLRAQLEEHGESDANIKIYSPMFNSGAFKVPWQKTVELIRQSFNSWEGQWFVLEPPPRK